MASFPKLIRDRAMDLIRAADAADLPLPTEHDLRTILHLGGERDAYLLLVDLADAHLITIVDHAEPRSYRLGWSPRGAAPAKRVEPSVKKPAAPNLSDEGRERMRAALARARANRAQLNDAVAAASAQPAPPPPPPPPPAVLSECATAAPPPTLDTKRLATAPGRTPSGRALPSRQVNMKVTAEVYDQLAKRQTGATPAQVARDIVIEALTGAPITSAPERTIIPAAVVAAAVRDNIPVCELVRQLLAIGLAKYEQGRTMDVAA